jgi:TetR/AcrR family transcriptional regulator, transcriptional repressor for nem operon
VKQKTSTKLGRPTVPGELASRARRAARERGTVTKERVARGAQTRSRIIQTAADLFHQKGARSTSPDQIIEASQTGKGQFYYYFGSKEGLVHAVLRAYLDAIETGTSPVDYEVTSWDALEQWFLAHLKLQQRYEMTRGCPYGTLANEVTVNDELIRQDLRLIFELVRNKLAAFFLREKAKGRLGKRADAERMAEFCIAVVQGAMLMGKLDRSSRPVEATAREALTHLKSYLITPAR